MKFLIVDDEPEICFFIDYEIKELGNDSVVAHSATEALKALEIHPDIEVVISDVRMPHMDGIEFLNEIKKANYKIKKFIFISGFSDLTEEKATSLGANALLAKPFEMQRLLELISPK